MSDQSPGHARHAVQLRCRPTYKPPKQSSDRARHTLDEHGGHLLEQVTREAAAHVEMVQLKSDSSCLIEDAAGVLDSFQETRRIGSAGTYVEADADHVKSEITGISQ